MHGEDGCKVRRVYALVVQLAKVPLIKERVFSLDTVSLAVLGPCWLLDFAQDRVGRRCSAPLRLGSLRGDRRASSLGLRLVVFAVQPGNDRIIIRIRAGLGALLLGGGDSSSAPVRATSRRLELLLRGSLGLGSLSHR